MNDTETAPAIVGAVEPGGQRLAGSHSVYVRKHPYGYWQTHCTGCGTMLNGWSSEADAEQWRAVHEPQCTPAVAFSRICENGEGACGSILTFSVTTGTATSGAAETMPWYTCACKWDSGHVGPHSCRDCPMAWTDLPPASPT